MIPIIQALLGDTNVWAILIQDIKNLFKINHCVVGDWLEYSTYRKLFLRAAIAGWTQNWINPILLLALITYNSVVGLRQ